MADETQVQSTSTQASSSEPVYEIGFHLVPHVGEEGVSKAVEAIRTLLGDAEIISEGYPQKMTLAYTVERPVQGKVEKYSESYFGFIKFSTPRERAQELRAALGGMREVMRFLLIETVREDLMAQKQRATFASDRLEGTTIQKPAGPAEKSAEVSEEELEKSIEALTG